MSKKVKNTIFNWEETEPKTMLQTMHKFMSDVEEYVAEHAVVGPEGPQGPQGDKTNKYGFYIASWGPDDERVNISFTIDTPTNYDDMLGKQDLHQVLTEVLNEKDIPFIFASGLLTYSGANQQIYLYGVTPRDSSSFYVLYDDNQYDEVDLNNLEMYISHKI